MESIHLEPTADTPKVVLDPSNGVFEFVGNSYPENTTKLYEPIIQWLEEFVEHPPCQQAVFHFSFEYFNTSSAKYIIEILRLLEDFGENGYECKVKWYYFEDDQDMEESGQDYKDTLDVPFELIPREDDEGDTGGPVGQPDRD